MTFPLGPIRTSTGLGFQLRLRRADAFQPTLLICHPGRCLVTAMIGAMLRIFRRIRGLRLIQPCLHFSFKAPLLLRHALVAHRLVSRGIGAQLGAIHRNMAKLDQPRRLAKPQYLHEQAPQGHQMPAPECADGAEIRLVQPSHRHHVHPLLAGTRQLP